MAEDKDDHSNVKTVKKRSFDIAFLAGKDPCSSSTSAFSKYSKSNPKAEAKKDEKEGGALIEEGRGHLSIGTPTSPSSSDGNQQNLLQFPALRKLLDITAAGAKTTPTSLSPLASLTLPPPPAEPVNLGPILPPTLALGLGVSNTCAKCGVTFRMTSDLVYHMRTHHSKGAQASFERKKESDRLRCNVCGENFRERHHLTRHMTAHQDRAAQGSQIGPTTGSSGLSGNSGNQQGMSGSNSHSSTQNLC